MENESTLMGRLSSALHDVHAHNFLLGMSHALSHQLAQNSEAKSTHAPVPLAIYGDSLPSELRSSWVFVLRAGMVHPPERHPNSIQRMFALNQNGVFETWVDNEWKQHPMSPGPNEPGLSIPQLVWHRPSKPAADWAVVSFHTVGAEELIEEVGDPQAGSVGSRRHYVSYSVSSVSQS